MRSRLPPRVQWKKAPRPPMQAWNKNRLPVQVRPEEGLTGIVQGQAASAYEERFSRAMDRHKRVEWYDFQKSYVAPAGMAGEKRLDFLVGAGLLYGIQIDGDWIHKSASARAQDAESDAELNVILRSSGIQPVRRIRGTDIETQAMTDRLVEELF